MRLQKAKIGKTEIFWLVLRLRWKNLQFCNLIIAQYQCLVASLTITPIFFVRI